MSTKKKKIVKKSDSWVELDINDPEPEPIKIDFSSQVKYKGQIFKAGGTHLDILGQRHVPYIGMTVEKDGKITNKLIEMDQVAYRFFVCEGLPITVAKALTAMAAAVRDETE